MKIVYAVAKINDNLTRLCSFLSRNSLILIMKLRDFCRRFASNCNIYANKLVGFKILALEVSEKRESTEITVVGQE